MSSYVNPMDLSPEAFSALLAAGMPDPRTPSNSPDAVSRLMLDESLAQDPSGIAVSVRSTIVPPMPAPSGRLVRQETMAAPAILRALPPAPKLKRAASEALELVSAVSPTEFEKWVDDEHMSDDCSCDDLDDDDVCDMIHAPDGTEVYVWKCECEQTHPGEYLRWRKDCSCGLVEYCLYCNQFVNNPVYTSPLDKM